MKENIHFAVLSGCCASAASTCGKLSGLPTFENYLLLRVFFFVLMIICNAGVWTLFVKALHQSDSSLVATVTSSASNYILSALTGIFLFGEITSLLWWSGMFFILIGLLLIFTDQELNKKLEENKTKTL